MRRTAPTRADFAFRVADTILPAYWMDHAPWIVFRREDVAAAFGRPIELPPQKLIDPAFLDADALLTVAEPAEIDGVVRMLTAIRRAVNRAITFDIAEQLAAENDRFELGLRLNNAGLRGDQRNKVLAARYPTFDPQRDDIWHAAHRRLMEQRKKHGLGPERAAIKRHLQARDLIVDLPSISTAIRSHRHV